MKVICYGASGHGRVIADILQCAGAEVVGFVDDGAKCDEFAGRPLLGTGEALGRWSPREVRLVVAIGVNATRMKVAQKVVAQGFQLITAVHPRAVVATDVKLGAGTVVMAGAVINPGTVVGENVIVNTGATVDHDCVLGHGVHICPGAHLAGTVVVGTGTEVGIGASVIQCLRIGENTTIGAGAVVIRDVESGTTVVGNPAREIQKRKGIHANQ